MRKLALATIVAAAFLATTGCNYGPYANTYSDVTYGRIVTENPVGDKTGEACATNIAGLVSFGDASLHAAARNGGISKIASSNLHFTTILGLYAQRCTLVNGS